MPSRAHRSLPALAALVAIVALGFALRMHDIGATSLWLDEAASWEQSRRTVWGMILATANDNYPPLHNFILHITIRLFGDGVVAMRVPSVLLGTATIWLIYRLGAALFDRTTGLIAALLLSLSVFHIWYSIEARMYALLCFTAVLYVCSTVRAWGAHRIGPYLWCAIAAVLLLYSHVYGALIFVAINLAVIVEAAWTGRAALPMLWRWMAAQALAVAAFLPWAFLLLRRVPNAEVTIGWIPEPTVGYVSELVIGTIGGPYGAWAIILVVMAGLFGTAVRSEGRPTSPAPRRFALLLLLCWLVIPMVIALLMSHLVTPLIVKRYLIGMLPAALLLLAAFVTGAFTHPWARAAAAACLSLPVLMSPDALSKPSWRTDLGPSIQTFKTQASPGDVVLYVPYRDVTFEYYVRNHEDYDLRAGEAALTDLPEIDRIWLVGFVHDQSGFKPLMDRLNAAGMTESYNSGDPEQTFSLFTRPGAAAAKAP
jgi:mannosyltransferase